MERDKSVIAVGEFTREPASVMIDREVKKCSVWTPFVVFALLALVAWVVFWKLNVAGMRPVISSAIAPVTASATSEPVAPDVAKAPAVPAASVRRTQTKAKSEPQETSTPGLDALIDKLNNYLRN